MEKFLINKKPKEEFNKKYYLDEDKCCWYSYFRLPKNMEIKDDEFQNLMNLMPEEDLVLNIMGKTFTVKKRKQKAFGKNYTFSGQTSVADEIPDIIKKYIDYMNDLEKETIEYNMALVNWYLGEGSTIGYHSDKTTPLHKDSSICCISFGEERHFCLKNKSDNKVTKIKLENNSVIIMGGKCQSHFKHSIPKSKAQGVRISLTFRKFK